MKLLSIFNIFKKKRKPSPEIKAIEVQAPPAHHEILPFFNKYRTELIDQFPKTIADFPAIRDDTYSEHWLPLDNANYHVIEQCGISIYTKEGTGAPMTETEFYHSLRPEALSDLYEVGLRTMRNEQFDVLGFLKDRAAARRN